MKRALAVLVFALCVLFGSAEKAEANQRAFGYCAQGGILPTLSGLTLQDPTGTVSQDVQGSYPGCTVTVYFTGTTNKATIFQDNMGTALGNPFTANSTTGYWFFYAANGRYDIQLSGAGIPITFTLGDISLSDPANQQAALPNTPIAPTCTPSFNATNNMSYSFTITGCNAVATVTGTPANGNLLSLTLVEDSTGGWTFTFPGNFILPLGFSFNTVALATNALTFKFDGTNWNLISNSGTGGGSNAQGPAGTGQISNGAGALAAGNTLDNLTTFAVNEDSQFKGPNPSIDVRSYGARFGFPGISPWNVGITGTISLGSPTILTLSGSSTGLQNTNGIGIVGAGPANGMTTPSAPTVTPSLSYGGTGTGLSTPGPVGATLYCYQVFAQNFAGGYTAASTQTCTSTGAASLGAQTATITSQSRSGTTVTVTTSGNHGFAPGCFPCGLAFIAGATNGFGGWEHVFQVADSTHFTYQTGQDTASGASTSSTGGTVTWYNDNLVTWPQVTNAFLYWIVGRTSGSTTVIGVSRPQGQTTSLYWEDFGSPMMDGLKIPYYIPSTAPASAGNNPLVTTICSGGGTSTLATCTAASNAVTGAVVLQDDGANILAAATANGFLPLYFANSSAGSGAYFVVNFPLALPSGTSIVQAGNVYLNAPVSMAVNSNWVGEQGASQGAPSFSASACPLIQMGNAIPGIFANGANSSLFSCLSFSGQNNNALLVAVDQTAPISFNRVNWQTNGNADYMGMHLLLRGILTNSTYITSLQDVNFTSGPSNVPGQTATPLLYCDFCGTTKISRASLSRRGLYMMFAQSGGTFTLDGFRMQGGVTPVLTAYNLQNGTGGDFTISNFEQDTPSSGNCLLDTLGQPNSYYVKIENSNGGICGNPIGLNSSGGIVLLNTFAGPLATGQNTNATAINGGVVQVSGSNSEVQSIGTSEIGYALAAPAAPTVVVGSHGSCSVNCVVAGTYYYGIAAVDAAGFNSPISGFTAATTDGTETITVSFTPVSGQVGFNPARGTSPIIGSGGGPVLQNTPLGGSTGDPGTGYSDLSTVNYSFSLFNMGFGNSASFSSAGLAAPNLLLSGGGFTSNETGTFTAARNVTRPDASFIEAGTNIVQTFTVAQSFTVPITVPSGGTGAATFTANGILYGNGTSAIAASAVGGAGTQCFTETNGGTPTWSSCAGSASTAWSSLTNPSTSLSLSMGTNTTTFTSGVLTGTSSPWTFTDGASTSTGSIVLIDTGASSTLHPITITAQGTSNGVQMSTGAVLAPIGSGVINSNLYSGATLTVSQGGIGVATLAANQLLYGNGTSAVGALTGSLIGTNPVLTLTSSLPFNVTFALNTAPSPTADIFDLNINSTKTAWFDNLGFLHTPGTTYNGSGILQISSTAGTCPTPVPGVYFICVADSTSLTIQTSLNGANFKPVPQLTNTSPTAFGVDYACSTFPQICTTVAGTTGQVLLSGGPSAAPNWGSLGVPGGGTGVATLTAHGVLMGEGTSPIDASSAGTTGQAFLSGGASADGAYGAINLAGGSTIVTGILPVANGGIGASTLAGASIVTATGAINVGHCMEWASATTAEDSGSACGGGGGSPALSSIVAGTASNTINSTTFPQTWNWTPTGSSTLMKFGENTAGTGSGNILVNVHTLATSTTIPFQADNAGNGWNLSSTGVWQPVGTGTLSLPSIASYAPTTAALFGYDSTNNRLVAGNGTNTSFIPWFTSAPTSGQIATFSLTLGLLVGTNVSGSGNVCLATSCVMTTPNLGIPSAGTLTNATGLPISTGVSGLGANAASSLSVSDTTFTTATAAVPGNTCNSTVTVTMTGVASSMAFAITPSTDVSGVVGWGSSGGLTIDAWPTVNTLNYKICNQTGTSITPGAVTFNVGVR